MSNNLKNTEKTEAEKKDYQDFLEVCLFIQNDILGYNANQGQKIQKKTVLRIRGLKNGQEIANHTHEQYGEYPFEVVLLTLKAYKNTIIRALNKKNIEDEDNKVAYISAIVRSKINSVYSKYLEYKNTQNKIETIDTSIVEYKGAEYKPIVDKEKNKINKNKEDKYKDLW